MQILSEELLPSECGLIQESATDGKTLWLRGCFMQSEQKNRNGRIYPMSEMSRAVNHANQMIVEHNGIFGELDHPQSMSINLDRVSHAITELQLRGNDVYGRAKLLNTPMGQIGQELVRSGVRLGVSSRGAGDVNESGMVSGYNFVTVDIVARPSASGAMPQSVYESLDSASNGRAIQTLAESIQHDPKAQEYFKREVMKWLSNSNFSRK